MLHRILGSNLSSKAKICLWGKYFDLLYLYMDCGGSFCMCFWEIILFSLHILSHNAYSMLLELA